MYQIGIISQPCKTLVSIQSALLESGRFATTTLTQPWRAVHAMDQRFFDALLLFIENERVDLNVLSLKLRSIFEDRPIVYLLPPKVLEKYSTDSKQTRIYLLNRETEIVDIVGILDKAILGAAVAHRAHLRYATAQNVGLVSNADRRGSGRLVNLGFEGAQVRVFQSNLKVGDRVQLHVYLNALKKDYLIPATVAWSRPEKDLSSPTAGAPTRLGLQFFNK